MLIFIAVYIPFVSLIEFYQAMFRTI